MPHHGNEEEHGSSESRRDAERRDAANLEGEPQKPIIHDNRKVDPKTGQARHPDQEHADSGDALSQAEDGDPVGDLEDVVEVVRDDDHPQVAVGQAPHEVEHLACLGHAECGGGHPQQC